MSSNRTANSLSDNEIQRLASEIAAGRSPLVWFTADAVGIAEGRSGKVIALADPSDPDYVRVRPTGSTDILSFSPVELTLTRPARRRHRHDAEPTSLFDI
ncbi:hypothetical protein [Nocardia crassostreae]|uniref:hypothetical protein n=1 Tax=Nocardia crassostreae TaxID=53428 RepID=UPI000835BC3E|nr:hypothetical protein [Nocardia crassostreae]